MPGVEISSRAREGHGTQWQEGTTRRRVMTVTDLFCHTSGITYGTEGGSQPEQMFEVVDVLDMESDLQLMTKKLGQMPLAFEPGTDWQYGASIDVLGRVVEVVSGQPLDEFLSTRIFKPLGMTDTGFYVPAGEAGSACRELLLRQQGADDYSR